MNYIYSLYLITDHFFLFAWATRKLEGQILASLHWLNKTRCHVLCVNTPKTLLFFISLQSHFSFVFTCANISLTCFYIICIFVQYLNTWWEKVLVETETREVK